MPDATAPFIAALPDHGPVTVVETHISWVLLAGQHAYKVKKPVTLPFLDYGTVDKRRACCLAELALNRRFAPELYLDVVELVTPAGSEPAVKMRRFDEAQRLDHVCRRGELSAELLSRFARDLASFQAHAAVAPAPTLHDAPTTILASAEENFDELQRLVPAQAARLDRLAAWTRAEFGRRAADFARRQAAGRIREGHGDLHLGNLVLLDGRITPFDGIEFNEDFRWIDVASEIAFTLLDLLDHGQPGLSTWLLDAWLTWSGDHDALTVMRFYLVYRAMVRAKVAAIQHKDGECSAYLDLAERLVRPATPTLTITFGPSGSGKTHTTSRRLTGAEFLDTVRIRSDVERKRLFDLAPDADSGGAIYSAQATRRTYGRLADLAASTLDAGWSVIVDAAFLRRAERDALRAIAAGRHLPFAIIAPSAPPGELARRIAGRQGDASEATAEILALQLKQLDPLDAGERSTMLHN